MCLEPNLIPYKQNQRRRDRDIASNKVPPIERLFKSRESLNQQNEDVQEQIESVDPDTAEDSEWVCLCINTLLVETSADTEMSEHDSRPGDVCSGSANIYHIDENLAGADLDVHEGKETPGAGC